MKIKSIAANQTEIVLTNGSHIFVSYETPVAAVVDRISYKTDRKYSNTTTKHINSWLGNGGINAVVKPQEFFDSLLN